MINESERRTFRRLLVTTPDYTPRLQARLEVEEQVVQDADKRGWAREAERHTAVAQRLKGLLNDLGESTRPDDPAKDKTVNCAQRMVLPGGSCDADGC
jgi:hypothetical protein